MERRDVIVAGGGPAGCAVAIELARRGCGVTLIEASGYERPRVGETFPPAIRPLLGKLGAWQPFLDDSHAPSYRLRSAWEDAAPHNRDFIRSPYGIAWHVDRMRFDAMLARCAEQAGAEVMRRTRLLSVVNGGEEWCVEVGREGRRHACRARLVVDATGRRGWVARRLGSAARPADRLIGAVAFVRGGSPVWDALIEAVEQGWWYSAPLPDGRMVVAFMTDADLWAAQRNARRGWADWLRDAPWTAERLAATAPDPEWRIVSAASMVRTAVGRNWLAAGDAAWCGDPLSGQGVCLALDSGLRAAGVIRRWLDGDARALDEYARDVAAGYERYLELRADYYGRVKRWAGAAFWARRSRTAADGFLEKPDM